MLVAIHHYVNSLNDPKDQHLMLLIENGSLVTKTKDQLGFWTRFKAWCGCGNASFKNVCSFIKRERDDLFKSPDWYKYRKDYFQFKQVTVLYNQNHVSWKKIKMFHEEEDEDFEDAPLYDFDPLPLQDRLRLDKLPLFPEFPLQEKQDAKVLTQLCRDLRHKWLKKDNWEDSEVEELTSYFDNFVSALELSKQICFAKVREIISPREKKGSIDTKEKEQIKTTYNKISLGRNEDFINALLQLRIAINAVYVKGRGGKQIQNDALRNRLHEVLKNIQSTALNAFFEEKLQLQHHKLWHYKVYYEGEYQDPKGYKQPKSPFITSEIAYWEKRLQNGKPVGFPKWFHCTPHTNIIPILNSEIRVLQQKLFKGAFASTTLEMGHVPGVEKYGNWGFALSDHIEDTATTNLDGTKVWPKHSCHTGKPFYGDQYVLQDSKGKPVRNYRYKHNEKFWVGFQRSISLAQVSKFENPIEYYRDVTLCYLVYRSQMGENDRHLLISERPPTKYGTTAQHSEKIKVLSMKKRSKDSVPNPKTLSPHAFKIAPSSQVCPELTKPEFSSRKIRVISSEQMEKISQLFKTSGDTFRFPTDWEGNFVSIK